MRFLACLIISIMLIAYYVVLNWLSCLLPLWLGLIVYVLGFALAIYLLTGVGRK